MAEGRMIKKEIKKSTKLARLRNEKARTLYFMIYPHADVEGRLCADAIDIIAECIPLFRWNEKTVIKALNDLHDSGLIVLYKVSNVNYLQITRFHDFQRIDRGKEAKSRIQGPENSGVVESTPSNSPISLSLSKDKLSISKDKLNILSVFEELWNTYPKKDGKKSALRHFKASIETIKDVGGIQKALTNYLMYIQNNKIQPQYVKNGSTWFNNWRDWVDYIPLTVKPKLTEAQEFNIDQMKKFQESTHE